MSMQKLAATITVLLLLTVGCGTAEDPGDPEAFCALLREGVGLTAGGVEGLDELEATAPPDIRSSVRKLANTARSLDEIPDSELDELFSAAFDPEAVEARNALSSHAVQECGSTAGETGEIQGPVDEQAAEQQLASYLATNFGTTTWIDELIVEAVFAFGRLDSLRAEFAAEPADPDDALAACNALAVYLYEIEAGGGHIEVTLGETLLAGRSGPTAQCVRP